MGQQDTAYKSVTHKFKAISQIASKMNVSKANAGRLVMTESAYFSSTAQKECFKKLDVERYEIVATLDGHTSDICQEMDGKVFKMSELALKFIKKSLLQVN